MSDSKTIMLMCSPAESEVAPPWIDEVLVHRGVWRAAGNVRTTAKAG